MDLTDREWGGGDTIIVWCRERGERGRAVQVADMSHIYFVLIYAMCTRRMHTIFYKEIKRVVKSQLNPFV